MLLKARLVSNTNMNDKRKRELNFSQNEKQLLISIISKYANIIEDKKTDRTSIDMKNKAWKDIEIEFNCASADGVFRNSDRLKKFFNNKKHDMRILEAEEAKKRYLASQNDGATTSSTLKDVYEEEKINSKKFLAEDKKYIVQTGLGRLPVRKRDGTEDVMLSIMNQKTLRGLPIHPFDSDNQATEFRRNEDVIVEYVFDPIEEAYSRPNNEVPDSAQISCKPKVSEKNFISEIPFTITFSDFVITF